MYANALITAGVKDAEVYVTAPTQVSGTAGLTGMLKAFEEATGKNISEDQKQVANEEMVRTSELGEKVGDEKAAEFMTRVKEEVAKQKPDSPEEVKQIVINIAGDLNIDLSNQETKQITNLMYKFSELNLDWDSFTDQLNQLKDKFNINTEEAQGFFDKVWKWFSDLFDWIRGLFS